jgi:hypothetical protein
VHKGFKRRRDGGDDDDSAGSSKRPATGGPKGRGYWGLDGGSLLCLSLSVLDDGDLPPKVGSHAPVRTLGRAETAVAEAGAATSAQAEPTGGASAP